MKKYKYIVSILLAINFNIVSGQSRNFILKDAVTKEVIPFATIYTSHGKGTYSDENGNFSISFEDSLIISHLSYEKIILQLKDLNIIQGNTVYMSPKTIILNETKIRPNKTKTISVGYYEEKTFSKRTGPGGNTTFNIYVNHLKNSTSMTGVLKKIYFDLSVENTDKSNSKVRIRIFSKGANGLPNEDVLTKEIFKKVDRFTPNIKIDVSEYNILFPPEGLFIGLEFFCTYKNKMTSRDNFKRITNCPHIPIAKVENNSQVGDSYYWTLHNGKFRWICYSDGSFYKPFKGYVFKFGADIEI